MLTGKEKESCIERSHIHKKDTGSCFVQVALLTDRINKLNNHLNTNKKDKHSKRGLLTLLSRRKKHISYVKKKSMEGYQNLLTQNGLRR